MKMLSRLTAITAALAITLAAAAPMEGGMFCRFTGQAMKPCPCPESARNSAKIEKQGCCEYRSAERSNVPAVAAKARIDGPRNHQVLGILVAEEVWISARGPGKYRVRTLDPPAEEHRFIRLKQLLI